MLFTALAVAVLGLVVILVTTGAFLLALVGGLMTGVPFVPAPRAVADTLADLCVLGPSSVFYDLGCGDGRFVLSMARHYPQARCIGLERAPLPLVLGRIRFALGGLPNARVQAQDFYGADLREATHIFLYLFPALMNRLLPKLEQELKPGARVVSCDFPFKNRAPSSTVVLGHGHTAHTLYVYDF